MVQDDSRELIEIKAVTPALLLHRFQGRSALKTSHSSRWIYSVFSVDRHIGVVEQVLKLVDILCQILIHRAIFPVSALSGPVRKPRTKIVAPVYSTDFILDVVHMQSTFF